MLETRQVHYLERVSSTMDVVHELADQGAPAGSVIIAGEQLEGRGSRGRTWHSPPGGLWISLLLRPATVAGVDVMSLRVGLAVAAAIESRTGCRIRLKWPNDLMVDHRKVGGILCEARWQGGNLGWVAVGIGVNVQNPVPRELERMAVSLGQLTPGVVAADLADPIISAVRALDLAAEQLSAGELQNYAQRDWLSGLELREPMDGFVTGVNADGSLAVRTPGGGIVAVRSGSVELADGQRKY